MRNLKSLFTETCRHCGKPIALATYRQVGSYEPDYDPFDDPMVWRHVGGYASCSLGLPIAAEPLPKRPEYVYVASSWRNPMQTAVCAALRSVGIDHYDFKNPPAGTGFSWKEVQPDHDGAPTTRTPAKGTDWEPVERYIEMVNHPRAIEGYASDFAAMERADTFVMVLPCGKSAHLELGWAVGARKRTIILLEDPVEPELMYRMVDHLATSIIDLLGLLGVED